MTALKKSLESKLPGRLLGAAAGGVMVREQISPHETTKPQASLGRVCGGNGAS
ncbi:hypothetical protein FOQG_06870 [Fusarium oxysporum f. sp. raphani 54005]|uniref:Uncharacterized protein n=12 Tax=Fusarium oxysporum species complex TaxID=171631 RepID=X0CIP8_FUSOX|nr:hypothetical protein FOXG_19010 [Fusarium oxysporum f. sp. lycopersici 4287]XP_031063938.1 uncharacterized protein FOIG_07312 [Fusarium odoratissimum NRRL 54006]EWZ37154.1 hypothetical protein FOZG_10983 [Fusarium oxysporum Fo47]EWZ90177.1 hypothetical protein FOWG_07922 [Fusarium oxysporum f. sp. lycopersici MN25]EXA44731.1 hypothetical protein FOVG_06066 [Fusarium oxysporum f. sp. pisi HDV247]EXK39195.1 hypothetical protein FOMG_06594 [Fusarium oxysporum f. sp. melonis 26406]EXK90679.1 h